MCVYCDLLLLLIMKIQLTQDCLTNTLQSIFVASMYVVDKDIFHCFNMVDEPLTNGRVDK